MKGIEGTSEKLEHNFSFSMINLVCRSSGHIGHYFWILSMFLKLNTSTIGNLLKTQPDRDFSNDGGIENIDQKVRVSLRC
jgi:hypothetical protein